MRNLLEAAGLEPGKATKQKQHRNNNTNDEVEQTCRKFIVINCLVLVLTLASYAFIAFSILEAI